jgi:hypothetical protein
VVTVVNLVRVRKLLQPINGSIWTSDISIQACGNIKHQFSHRFLKKIKESIDKRARSANTAPYLQGDRARKEMLSFVPKHLSSAFNIKKARLPNGKRALL